MMRWRGGDDKEVMMRKRGDNEVENDEEVEGVTTRR